jgi:hypothetical protein
MDRPGAKAEFAERMGVDRTNVSGLELELRDPTIVSDRRPTRTR